MNPHIFLSSLADCPVCGPILEDIAKATDFAALQTIMRRTIPHSRTLTTEQRAELQAAVSNREKELVQ